MRLKLKNNNLTFRKLKIEDYKQFKKLFYFCFKKEISYKFYKWRYIKDKYSFCYGVFDSSKLIANVGMKSLQLSNKKKDRIFSRHSSMVLKKYRGKGVFSYLLYKVKKNFLYNVKFILMWPNSKNLATFGVRKNKILKKKFFLYKTFKKESEIKKTKNHNINQLNKFKFYIKNNKSFLLKNFNYFKNRYILYNHHEYLINRFETEGSKSFLILKKIKENSDLNYLILDHFGSSSIMLKHMNQLIDDYGKVVFWSVKKIDKLNYKLVNITNLNIGLLKIINSKKKLKILFESIMPGDTDSFITLK